MAQEDAIDLLLEQHEQIRSLFGAVENAEDEERREQFGVLLRLLAVHETAEEMVLYPAVRASVPDGALLVEPRLQEEDQSKKLLAGLESMGTDSPDFLDGFAELRASVLDHAENEEREIFSSLRTHLSDETLTVMRAGLVAAEAAAPTHPHSFAPESATGNYVLGPMVSVVDRVRDAIKAVGNRSK